MSKTMSDPNTGPKYAPGGTTDILPDGTAMTKHARFRYIERTPHTRTMSVERAYRLGEDIPHPSLVGDETTETPNRARVFHNADGWGVVFVIKHDSSPDQKVTEYVATVIGFRNYQHQPSLSYLRAIGPHTEGQ
jgi:hypothetical protein